MSLIRALRDKDYVRTVDGLLFNVTGYEHPEDAVFASLKYIDDKKWTGGYRAAMQFLRTNFPKYVGEYIQVPLASVAESYCPFRRLEQLRANPPVAPKLRLAQQLISVIAQLLDLSEERFGITDSLLWGPGHENSDIDLVVYGDESALRVLTGMAELYGKPHFERPSPLHMKAPYGFEVPDWESMLARKWHMGAYQGTLFSLRAVRERLPMAAGSEKLGTLEGELRVVDSSQSLFFPAVYIGQEGHRLLDYTVVWEGVLSPGDAIRGTFEGARRMSDGGTDWITIPSQVSRYTVRFDD